jgi:lipid-A-disaccharide synthase-like uncharacterized protein
MSNGWRELPYPLGYLSAIAFGGRFLLQWLTSEIKQKSVVTRAFWQLSLAGNLLLFMHSFIQVQFHVCVVQACNAVISWRNLNLMQPTNQQLRFQTIIYFLLASVGTTALAFSVQGLFLSEGIGDWFRLPAFSGQNVPPRSLSLFWHFLGTLGVILFSSRFWVQWWCAERQKTSYLGPTFWWLSLVGGVLSLVYFVRIEDPVNIIGPLFGLLPYIRNLMLLQKQKVQEPSIAADRL